jgi:hypothetical protein
LNAVEEFFRSEDEILVFVAGLEGLEDQSEKGLPLAF